MPYKVQCRIDSLRLLQCRSRGCSRSFLTCPYYTCEDDGESQAFPCTEIELAEETTAALIDAGFMPLAALFKIAMLCDW
jgi:hypothetical protein